MVQTTLEVVESSRWLNVTLDEQDRLALREVLLARGSGSANGWVPASSWEPSMKSTGSTRWNRFYRQLVKSLGDWNVALTRATDRLS